MAPKASGPSTSSAAAVKGGDKGKAADKDWDEEAPHVPEKTDQEERCEQLFVELRKDFKKLVKLTKPDKIHEQVKAISSKLRDIKAAIKAFEDDARADGMPAKELNVRKKALARELNAFIQQKKDFAQAEGDKGDLLNGAGGGGEIEGGEQQVMSQEQIVRTGKRQINEQTAGLERIHRLAVENTTMATATLATLHDQAQKTNRIADEVHEVNAQLKKASAVIRDITRGFLTDKCIAFLLLLVVLGVVAIIVVKVLNPKKVASAISSLCTNVTIANTTVCGAASSALTTAKNATSAAVTGRRMLSAAILQLLAEDDF